MNFKEKLNQVTTFALDIDGVLTNGMVTIFPDGTQVRQMSTRDGFAMQYAVKQGFNVVVISGGTSESVISRLNKLGVENVFLGVKNKLEVLNEFTAEKNINKSSILYMGDDLPDYEVMQACGVKTCPNNAAYEIKAISDYISPKNGGEGCVRDVIEQTLRCQNKWVKLNTN
jgi:3-deoxy-D-manno-octulosonate 8-phosphate phosphatase (KDO 8-P phosphatase)